LKLKQFILVQL